MPNFQLREVRETYVKWYTEMVVCIRESEFEKAELLNERLFGLERMCNILKISTMGWIK